MSSEKTYKAGNKVYSQDASPCPTSLAKACPTYPQWLLFQHFHVIPPIQNLLIICLMATSPY